MHEPRIRRSFAVYAAQDDGFARHFRSTVTSPELNDSSVPPGLR
jgi:hypothetical protein